MDKKRAVILYRMSTDRQDLETQKKMNRNFCAEKDFEIVGEFFEDGVSGYKNSLEKRPDLIAILNKAERREFDVFIVYILDRIVRREEEYPLIVNHLTKNEVEIWASSTKEKIKVEHTDKLTNYITGWNNEYESIKTSMRVKDAMRSKNENGKYMGGVPPYGYEIYKTGEINQKGRAISDIRINDSEAEMIRLIFDMYNNKNYGVNLITKTLNEMGFKSRNGKGFRQNSVSRILKNPIYSGRKPYNVITSTRDKIIRNDIDEWKTQPYRDDLRIVDDQTFYAANSKIRSRRDLGGVSTPRNSKQLFSGLVYCGYCGAKLVTDYTNKRNYRKDGTYSSGKWGTFKCKAHKQKTTEVFHPQSSFSAIKFQKIALNIIYKFMQSQINKDKLLENINEHKNKNMIEVKRKIALLDKEVSDSSKLIQKLEAQIDQAIMIDDIAKVDILTRRIESSENKIQEGRLMINKLSSELQDSIVENSHLLETYNMLDTWTDKFENSDDAEKKTMLLNVVDKVYFTNEGVDVVLKLAISTSIKTPFDNQNEYGVSDSIPSGMGVETHDKKHYSVLGTIPTGMGGPDYSIKGEFSSNGHTNNLKHEKGVISMARSGHPDSAGSQFFLMTAKSPHLDGSYAGFGQVVEGIEEIERIEGVKTNFSDKPLEEQKIKEMTVETFGVEYDEPQTV